MSFERYRLKSVLQGESGKPAKRKPTKVGVTPHLVAPALAGILLSHSPAFKLEDLPTEVGVTEEP